MLLLSTRGLIDLIWKDRDIEALLSNYRPDQIHLSVISIGRATELIKSQVAPTDPDYHRYNSSLQTTVGMIRSKNNIQPFDDHCATRWAELLPLTLDALDDLGSIVPLGDDSRQVVATAWQNNLQLVEPSQPYHAVLSASHQLVFKTY